MARFPKSEAKVAQLAQQIAESRAEARIRGADKNRALKTLKDSMRANLRYAEVMARRHRLPQEP